MLNWHFSVDNNLGLMYSRLALVTLVLGTSAACLTSRERSSLSLEELGEHLARTVCLGPPTKVEPVPNQHVPGQTDHLETRQCFAGSSTFYVGETTSNPNGLAVAAEIRAPRSGLPQYMEIGQPVEKAVQVLGAPKDQTTTSITYGLGLEGVDTFTIHHSAGRISSVQWAWLVD